MSKKIKNTETARNTFVQARNTVANKISRVIVPLAMVMCMMTAAFATDGTEVFQSAVDTLTNYVKIAGGLISLWGVVILGTNLKDHNGSGISNGVWTMVGGAVILGAAALFGTVV